MDSLMTDPLSALILGVGLSGGAFISWLIVRSFYSNKMAALKVQSQVESNHFSEKLNHQADENGRLKAEFTKAELRIESYRQQLGKLQNEQAQHQERLKRLPELSQELEQARVEIIRISQDLSDLREKFASAESTIVAQEKQIFESGEATVKLKGFRDELLEEKEILQSRIATLEAELQAERQQSQEKLILLSEAKEELSNQFKALANDILEEKTKRFTKQNKENLDELLNPLKTKLGDFQSKVEEVYINEGKERSAMAEQIRQVMDLNKQLSSDAHNLTRALKGQSKAQGNWGEMILERVLDLSGLRKGQEYEVQESIKREDGKRLQPDVVIHLPESRHLVIDAKVTLTAYEAYVNAESDNAKEIAIKRHLESMRAHIKGLSSKAYQTLYGVESLDFVIMFVPVEPAFTLASLKDSTLWQDAWKQNVLLVSPSTLLFVVRTVAHLWRQEHQSRNAQEIASRGAELYNKFVGFVEDLDKLGERINLAKTSYDSAYKKLSIGRGNLVRQTELLIELGVKPKKSLPQEVVIQALEGADLLE